MPILTVRADAVQVGDELYDPGYYMARFGRPWVKVTKVEQVGEYVVLTTDAWVTWKHPGEGMGVKWPRPSTPSPGELEKGPGGRR